MPKEYLDAFDILPLSKVIALREFFDNDQLDMFDELVYLFKNKLDPEDNTKLIDNVDSLLKQLNEV